MIKLMKYGSNDFEIICATAGVSMQCGLEEAVSVLVILGVRSEEIAYAMDELTTLGHDMADFGISGGFTYSKRLPVAA